MARYREGLPPGLQPPEADGFLLAAAVLGLIMAVGFVIAGWRGRQWWLLSWGGGLVAASLWYLGVRLG